LPCLSRASDIERYDPRSEFALAGDEEGWVATHQDPAGDAAAARGADADLPDLDDAAPGGSSSGGAATQQQQQQQQQGAAQQGAAGSSSAAGQQRSGSGGAGAGGAAAAAGGGADEDDLPDISDLELVEPEDEVRQRVTAQAWHTAGTRGELCVCACVGRPPVPNTAA
jgi:hypothetical protein